MNRVAERGTEIMDTHIVLTKDVEWVLGAVGKTAIFSLWDMDVQSIREEKVFLIVFTKPNEY